MPFLAVSVVLSQSMRWTSPLILMRSLTVTSWVTAYQPVLRVVALAAMGGDLCRPGCSARVEVIRTDFIVNGEGLRKATRIASCTRHGQRVGSCGGDGAADGRAAAVRDGFGIIGPLRKRGAIEFNGIADVRRSALRLVDRGRTRDCRAALGVIRPAVGAGDPLRQWRIRCIGIYPCALIHIRIKGVPYAAGAGQRAGACPVIHKGINPSVANAYV